MSFKRKFPHRFLGSLWEPTDIRYYVISIREAQILLGCMMGVQTVPLYVLLGCMVGVQTVTSIRLFALVQYSDRSNLLALMKICAFSEWAETGGRKSHYPGRTSREQKNLSLVTPSELFKDQQQSRHQFQQQPAQ